MSGDHALQILRGGDFSQLIGLEESLTLDFKLHWDLSSRRDVRSMAADVAAFANAAGGVLVLGVRTRRDPNFGVERAAEVAGLPEGAVGEAERVRKMIAHHCIPLVRVQYTTHEGFCDGRRLVLASLVVEPQDPLHSPVLAQRLVDTEDAHVSDALGWPIRHGDGTEWVPAARLQQMVSTALNLERHLAGAGMSSAVDRVPTGDSATLHDSLLDHVITDHELETYLILRLKPSEPSRIADFYGDFADAARSWPPVRAQGFGRWFPFKPVQGCLASLDAGRSVIVGPDGVVSALAAGTKDFLGWGSAYRGEESLTINAFPLVEFISEVIRFTYGVVRPAVESDTYELSVVACGLDNTRLDLLPGRAFFSERPQAIVGAVEFSQAGTSDWDSDAFSAIARFMQDAYAVRNSDVPWQRDRRIDLQLLD